MSFLRFSLSVFVLALGLDLVLSRSLPLRAHVSLGNPSSVAGYLIQNDWQVSHSSVHCAPDSCCCFNNAVNIYAGEHGVVYVNGSVSGTKCSHDVEQDELRSVTSYTFSSEFFGINDYVFTLSNATVNNGTASLTAWAFTGKSASTSCSFQLIRLADEPLAPAAPISPPKPPLAVPDFVSPYLGNWTFDNTCNATSLSCCCFVGWANITVDPDNDPNLIASGPPSVGCGLGPFIQEESDDFPWPSAGTTTASSVQVKGFLAFQEDYQITLSYPQTNLYSLYFQNTVNPMCSLRATKVGTPPPPTNDPSNSSAVVLAVAVIIVVIILLASFALGAHYCRKTRASRRATTSNLSDRLTHDSGDYDNMVEVADR